MIEEKEHIIEELHDDVYAFPASSSQKQLWFLDQFDPNSVAYNIPFGISLKGKFDVASFEKAVNKLIERHEVFRTYFAQKDNELCQFIQEKCKAEVVLLDIVSLIPEQKNIELERIIRKEQSYHFDLSKAPLFRSTIIKLNEDEHYVVLVSHHIILDNNSVLIFTKELEIFYNNYVSGRDANLPAPSLQYADIVIWQNQDQQIKNVKDKLKYWTKKLKDQSSYLDLPTDYTRPSRQLFSGKLIRFSFKSNLSIKIREFSKKERSTIFNMLLSAYKIMLYKYSSQNDITIGTPFANRLQTEMDDVIGCCMNTLPLRDTINSDNSFLEILEKVKSTTMEAHQHQEVPFDLIVEELHPQRNPSYNPLYQVLFTYQDQLGTIQFKDTKTEFIAIHNGSAKFDLNLWMWDSTEGISGQLEYNTDLYTEKRIGRFIKNFETLVTKLVENPNEQIGKLGYISREENEILERWNKTDRKYRRNITLIDLFEEQVKKTPNSTAVKYEGKILTYSQLNEKANQLGNYLKSKSIDSEMPVGIFMERSLEMVIGIYGILKAGGAYMPLDPDYPEDRLNFMIEDADLKIILTQDKFLEKINSRTSPISLEKDWGIISKFSIENPTREITEESLAYIIYTSGSTGKPKGVLNIHKGICNRLLWMDDEYKLNEKDSVLQKTPFSFDVSVWEFFWPLFTGATLVVAKPGGHKESSYLAETIQKEKISTIHFVPSMLKIFLDNPNVENCKTLRHVFCSGEALEADSTERFFQRLDAELHNLYGPTEAAVDVTYYECERSKNIKSIPIGKPIANTKIYILDKNLNKVPIGVQGEIHIGGVNLAKGYLKRKELTEEKFIMDPFSDGRLYKTGDKGRYGEDGNIEFLGRKDFQVKIRGFRIELGEIESALKKNANITDAVIINDKDSAGNSRLVAYIVTSNNLENENLKDYLTKSLPDYMVPNIFMPLDKIPLSQSGKVDRKSLPNPVVSNKAVSEEVSSPRNEIEYQLLKIWEKVLGIKSIGIEDNFFMLGGHSLLAAQMFNLIEKQTGKRLPLSILFQAPTIKKLAEIVSTDVNFNNWSSLVPIKPSGSRAPLFLIHGAEGYVLFYHQLASRLDKDQPVYGIQSIGLNDPKHAHDSLEKMATHYIKEIKDLQPEGPYLLGGYCMGGTIAFEMARQLKGSNDEVALIAMLETMNIKSNPNISSFWMQSIHKVQNIIFHFENILSLPNRKKIKFFREKFSISKARFIQKKDKVLSRYNKKLKNAFDGNLVKENEAAQFKYKPEILDANITIFRPKKGFMGLNDLYLGWENKSKRNIKIKMLNVSPRGMLVDPFVEELARELSDSIKESNHE